MIELNLDIKFNLKPWKKALVISFFYYLIALIIVIFIFIIKLGEFNFKLISMIFGIYLIFLILTFHYMNKIFENKYIRFE